MMHPSQGPSVSVVAVLMLPICGAEQEKHPSTLVSAVPMMSIRKKKKKRMRQD